MQISPKENLHEMPKSIFCENKNKNISISCLLNFYPSMLSVKGLNKKKNITCTNSNVLFLPVTI